MTEEVQDSNEDELFNALSEACVDQELDDVVNCAIDLIVGAVEMAEDDVFKREVIVALMSAASALAESEKKEESLIQLLN